MHFPNYRRFSFTSLLMLLLCGGVALSLHAQCPPATTAGVHVVQKGENLFRVAQRYEVSMDQISTWNNLGPQAKVYECQELVVSAALTHPAPAAPATYGSTTTLYAGTPEKQDGKWHTVRPGETTASIAEIYGYTEAKFRDFNKLPAGRPLNVGAVVRSAECTCEDDPAMASPTLASRGVASPTPATTNRSYMTLAESAMLDEINLLRSDPRGYVAYVRDFVANQKATRGEAYSSTYVNSLIQELQTSPRLSTVQAHPCLYQVAKAQGDYLKSVRGFSHKDAFGVGPWSRTKNTCPQVELGTSALRNGMTVGNENLVAGMSTARQAVIYLLIDEYEPTTGHRATLLAPEWRYAAAYNFGTIGNMPNHYVQVFGR